LEVRTYKPGEKGKEVRRWLFWPLSVALIGVLVALTAFVAPRWLGYDREIENKLVTVTVNDAPDTRTQVIASLGDRETSAKLPDLSIRGPNGSAKMLLERIVDPKEGKLFANKFVNVQNAQIQRVLGDDVITVGSSPGDEIFVHVPLEARPSRSEGWGPQLDAKARVNVAGYLKLMPPPDRARALLRLSELKVESKPLAPVYLEATKVRVVANKPMFGSE
jgi:hypothetical protein